MLATLWFVLVFVVAIWVWPRTWAGHVEHRVQCQVAFDRRECDIGEGIPLVVTVINRSWLPIPYAKVVLKLPNELSTRPDQHDTHLSFTTYVLMRRRVQMTFTLYGYHRGPSTISDIVVRMHEGLGIRSVYAYDQTTARIAVRPERQAPNTETQQPWLPGNQLADRWLFPDETMFKGVRPYQVTDAAKHIDWRASARMGQTMSKQFFSSTQLDVLLLLNAQTTFPHWAGSMREPFEALCTYVTHQAIKLDKMAANILFATNAVIVGERQGWIVRHLHSFAIRSLIGHAHPYAAASLTPLLTYLVRHRDTTPRTILLYSAFETDEQQQILKRLQKQGKTVLIVRAPEEAMR